MSNSVIEKLIVAGFLFGVLGTILAAASIHKGFGLFMSAAWVVFASVMAAVTHEANLKRQRAKENRDG